MLYGRRCKTPVCWDEVGSRELACTDVVLATTEKIETIRERLKAAQERWKSYANNRRRQIEFNEGDLVMLKDNKQNESSRRSVRVEISSSISLVSCDGLGGYDWSDQH
nr:hypothetical protein [Tanacetum cinerariifolium]